MNYVWTNVFNAQVVLLVQNVLQDMEQHLKDFVLNVDQTVIYALHQQLVQFANQDFS